MYLQPQKITGQSNPNKKIKSQGKLEKKKIKSLKN